MSRRSLLGSIAASPLCLKQGSGAVPQAGLMERSSLDLGHRATRSGPVVSLSDGSAIWITTEPEPPYLAKAMWSISRIVMRRSKDGGRSWGEPQVLLNGTREYSLLSHALRLTASGKLLHIFVRYSGYDYETASPAKSLCEVFAHRSADGGGTWEEPRKLPTGQRYNGDVLSIEQLRDGRVVYPFAFLTSTKGQFATSVLYSDDEGATWHRSRSTLEAGGGGFESGANEPSLVELPDGRLWMLIRAQTGFQWESFSTDRGVSWSPAAPSRIPSSNAPATMLRLRSGEIAIAWNNDVQSNYARQSLVLGITRDGRSFRGVREIDGTDFPDNPAEPVLHVTYPYLTELPDGTLLVSYNKGHWMRNNRPTLARVRPEWVVAREEIVNFQDGRTGWHTINPGPRRAAAIERYTSDQNGLWLELEQAPKITEPAGITRNVAQIVDGHLRAALRVMKPEASLLIGDSLLAPGAAGSACLRVRFTSDGIMLGAGMPERADRPRGTTSYSFVSYPVRSEIRYPATLPDNGTVDLSVYYRAADNRSIVRMNEGPEVTLTMPPILGLSYMSFVVSGGGAIAIRELRINSK